MTQVHSILSIREIVASSVDQYARRKPAAGQPDLFSDPEDMPVKQGSLFSTSNPKKKKDTEDAGRWITMSGTHVFVSGSGKDEKITKGPENFVGKHPKEVEAEGQSEPASIPDEKPTSPLSPPSPPEKPKSDNKPDKSSEPLGFSRHIGKMSKESAHANVPKVGDRFSHKGQMHEISSVEKPYYHSKTSAEDMEDFGHYNVKPGWHVEYKAKPVSETSEETSTKEKAKSKGDAAKSMADLSDWNSPHWKGSESIGQGDERLPKKDWSHIVEKSYNSPGRSTHGQSQGGVYLDGDTAYFFHPGQYDDYRTILKKQTDPEKVKAIREEIEGAHKSLKSETSSSGMYQVKLGGEKLKPTPEETAREEKEKQDKEEAAKAAKAEREAKAKAAAAAIPEKKAESKPAVKSASKPVAKNPSATFSKLKDGSWGLRVSGKVKAGDTVSVTKKDGSRQTKKVAKVIHSSDDSTIVTFYERALIVDEELSIRDAVHQSVDRYCRDQFQSQVQIDHYAHPLVHAAVGGLAHMAVQSFAPRSPGGIIKKIAHAAVASAMAAWISSSNAGMANQNHSNTPIPTMTAGQHERAGNQIFNQIAANAMAQHAQRQQAAANAPPSPNVQHAHAVAAAAGARAGVRPLNGTVSPVATKPPASPAGKVSSAATTPGPRPLREPGNSGGKGFSGDDHPRETTSHDGKRPGEFAPKGEGQTGSGSDSDSDSSSESPASPAEKNYPDNLNKPADQQTNYLARGEDMTGGGGGNGAQPPEPQKSHAELIREFAAKNPSGKTAPTKEWLDGQRQSRKEHWAKTIQDLTQKAIDQKTAKKDQKQQAKIQSEKTSFDPSKLETESSKTLTDRQAKKSIIPDIASEHDLDHETLSNAVQDELKMLLPAHQRQEEARQYISKIGWHAGRINRKEDSYKDHSTTNLDENASEWAGLFPEIAGHDESEWVAKMWDLSKQGKQDPPSANDEELVRRVAKRLVDQGYANSSSFPAEEGSDDENLQPVHGSPGDVDYTPFSRAYVDMIVDKYLRVHGVF